MKIPNKRELQQIAINDSSDIVFKDFMKIYKNCRKVEKYSFLVIMIQHYHQIIFLCFRKNLLE